MRLVAAALVFASALAGPVAAHAADADSLDGVWEGSYICGQGRTFLRLTLDGSWDGQVSGTFFFSSVSWSGGQNLTVPDGSFRVAGRLDDSGNLTLNGVSWIQQPENYSMVNLSGRVLRDSKGPFLRGSVSGVSGCSEWEVGRPGA